uniref:prolycopene isomerase n=1 Tax=Rhodosorus marinus TaxID=101924 RepID=A0A7S0BTZ9_9RHOD
MGGLVTATQLASKGLKVRVLEKYLIPGGSSGYFKRDGYTFDVGASMIFGLGDEGYTNLLTRALDAVGKKIDTKPDPTIVTYYLPDGLTVPVDRNYDAFMDELRGKFPSSADGLKQFYDTCADVFKCLNEMELLSLEEPRYLLKVFFQKPVNCLKLLWYMFLNAADEAGKTIADPVAKKFVDIECFLISVAGADRTPLINTGMVFADRHYGGANYPIGGVGKISLALAEGLEEYGGKIEYGARVRRILVEDGKAVGVLLANGEELRAPTVISNATRWDTFENLMPKESVPKEESVFRERYRKTASFISLHAGVKRDKLPKDLECHMIILDDYENMENCRDAEGTLFVSVPTVLDSTIAPDNRHIFHIFTASDMDEWEGLSSAEYKEKKEELAAKMLKKVEAAAVPGLTDSVELLEVGTPRTHRRFLGRIDGTYGPVPRRVLRGLSSMPFNKTAVPGLYCVGDSSFPGQGLNAVAFSGFSCAHRVAADVGKEDKLPLLDEPLQYLLGRKRLELFNN